MENTTYIALSKQMTLAQEMNKIAHNMANVNTTGFKSQHLILTEYQNQPKDRRADAIKMVLDYGDYRNTTSGAISLTGNTYDFALEGSGYFTIQHKDTGNTFYTRAGNFTLNNLNELVTSAGHRVVGNGGPIVIPEGTARLEVTKEGVIATEDGELDQFALVSFENESQLREFGNNLYTTNQPPEPAVDTIVRQGALEGSNVQAIVEMTRMIDVSRQYQITQRMIQTEHERMQNAIRKLGTVNA